MLQIFWWRNLKAVFNLKDQTKFWISSWQNIGSNQACSSCLVQDDTFKHVALFNCFKQGFNCIADIKMLILVAKKNTLKATETEKQFLCTFYHESRFTSHQFDAAMLLKKIFEGVCNGNFKQSGQVKFEKFLCLAPTMVAHPGSLNSWSQWINGQPL